MSLRILIFMLLGLAGLPAESSAAPIALVIHGGAGTMNREALSARQEAAIRGELDKALDE